MNETTKKIDLSAIFYDLKPETAGDVVHALMDMDMHLWISLAVDFSHPPTALVDLIKKSGMKFPEGTIVPNEQEKVLLVTGALEPSKRLVEIALFVANDPESLQKFEALGKPLKVNRDNLILEGIARTVGAKVNKTVQ